MTPWVFGSAEVNSQKLLALIPAKPSNASCEPHCSSVYALMPDRHVDVPHGSRAFTQR